MRTLNMLFFLSVICLFGACSTTKQSLHTGQFHDELFQPKPSDVHAEDMFKLSAPMQQYLETQLLSKGSHANVLYEALSNRFEIKLDYDAQQTRTAAEAFESRTGNCLSLVIMTAAFAKAMKLKYYFNGVQINENWLLQDGLFFSSGHINLTLNKKLPVVWNARDKERYLTIDFTPVEGMGHTWPLSEKTVVAMYLNNRAAENLAAGALDSAYWWAKESIQWDPEFWAAHNTLAVVYRRKGKPEIAESVLKRALERDPNNATTLANLAIVLRQLKRNHELGMVLVNLKKAREAMPYHYFNIGQKAMREKNFVLARKMFLKEIKRQPNNHQFYFELAKAYAALGDKRRAGQSLTNAATNSTTLESRGIYRAKLDALRAQ